MSQFTPAVEATHKFRVVARTELGTLSKEWDLVDQAGAVDKLSPQIAKPFSLSGVKFVAGVTIDNFQDVTQRATVEGQFGNSAAERRTITLGGVLKVFESTSGDLLHSTAMKVSLSATDEVLAGAVQEGRATNSLIGDVTSQFVASATSRLVEALYPARVLAYTLGQITFNRGSASGAAVGQIWEVFAEGSELVDPDSGASLGREELHMGWMRVISVGASTSRGEAIEDVGIDNGLVLRPVAGGLPAWIDASARPRGNGTPRSAASGSANAAAPSPTVSAAPAASPTQSTPSLAAPSAASARAQDRPLRLAIFIKDRADNVPDERVMALEDQLATFFTARDFQVLRREDVMNAVAAFAVAGANSGTGLGGAPDADQLLSDRTSALRLAENLSADGLLMAAVDSYDTQTFDYKSADSGLETRSTEFTLRVTWQVLDGATGASISAGSAAPSKRVRINQQGELPYQPLNELLEVAARQMGAAAQTALRGDIERPIAASAGSVPVQLGVFLTDLYLPDVVRTADGDWKVTTGKVGIGPMNVTIELDGLAVGTAPSTLGFSPGLHRLRLTRSGLEPVEQMINVRPGLALNIPMKMTPEGYAMWKEQTKFLQDLKQDEVMQEIELERAKAIADFIKRSNLNINIDTSQVKALGVGGHGFWGGLIESSIP
ncbi:MAG: PEGA domain-containing protein [Phycisphaerales bacterium]|nr:PEGA domain-containing protein [Phycisphaerales bacterium]